MTARTITRRQIVGAVASSSLLSLSGCEARGRSLSFDDINVTKQQDTYEMEVEVRAGASNIENKEWGTFHDVVLIVMTEGKEKIHREPVDDVGGSIKDTVARSFSVEKVPQYLIYNARESTCDDRTQIDKAVRYKHEGEYFWRIREMTCEEEQEFLS